MSQSRSEDEPAALLAYQEAVRWRAEAEQWKAEAERLGVENVALRAENVELRARVGELEGEVAALMEKVATLSRLAFGKSSENKPKRAGSDGAVATPTHGRRAAYTSHGPLGPRTARAGQGR
jgi:hypothetical protein